jgi:hypothetical protein
MRPFVPSKKYENRKWGNLRTNAKAHTVTFVVESGCRVALASTSIRSICLNELAYSAVDLNRKSIAVW